MLNNQFLCDRPLQAAEREMAFQHLFWFKTPMKNSSNFLNKQELALTWSWIFRVPGVNFL